MFEKIEKFVACACVAVMAVLVFANVVARFVFKHSLAVSDEMSTYLFVLMSFMGTAIAARRKAHLGLSIVTDRVSPKARIIIHLTVYAISALFCLLIVVTGVQMVISQYRLGSGLRGSMVRLSPWARPSPPLRSCRPWCRCIKTIGQRRANKWSVSYYWVSLCCCWPSAHPSPSAWACPA